MKANVPILHTERLVLRPLDLADAPAIQRLFPRWEIVRLMASVIPWPYLQDGAADYLERVALPAMARGEAWHWAIELKTMPRQLIGVVSLMRKEDDNRGFWLASEWQGHGYMTEASAAATDFWFDELGQTLLKVPKAVDNVASRRISQRSGMRVVWTGVRDYVSGPGPAEIWEVSADEWWTHRARNGPHSGGVPPAWRPES